MTIVVLMPWHRSSRTGASCIWPVCKDPEFILYSCYKFNIYRYYGYVEETETCERENERMIVRDVS